MSAWRRIGWTRPRPSPCSWGHWCSACSLWRRDGREIRLLEVADLTLDYPDFHACYSLQVPEGALCGLIGPSGGGKTTLLHAIAGFARPARGRLSFAGRD